jgi:hypothetical protein
VTYFANLNPDDDEKSQEAQFKGSTNFQYISLMEYTESTDRLSSRGNEASQFKIGLKQCVEL